MANNVDFTNERPYDQYEHARALKSACANRIDGMDYSNGTIQSGYGIIYGSPFQTNATTINGSGYVTVNIQLTESGNAGIGDVSITLENSRKKIDNGTTKKYSIYQVDGAKIINDYRYSDIVTDLQIDGSGNKFQVRINGVKSNYYTIPITASGSVDLSNYYNKQEIAQLNIEYEFKELGHPSIAAVSFNPNDYAFIMVGHYDKTSYINYMHPVYHKQFNTATTTFSFGDNFFAENNGNVVQTLTRLKLAGLNTTNASASISAYRCDNGGAVDQTSYRPNKLIGVKMVIKS